MLGHSYSGVSIHGVDQTGKRLGKIDVILPRDTYDFLVRWHKIQKKCLHTAYTENIITLSEYERRKSFIFTRVFYQRQGFVEFQARWVTSCLRGFLRNVNRQLSPKIGATNLRHCFAYNAYMNWRKNIPRNPHTKEDFLTRLSDNMNTSVVILKKNYLGVTMKPDMALVTEVRVSSGGSSDSDSGGSSDSDSGSSSDSDSGSNQHPNMGLHSLESRDGYPNLLVGSGSSSDSDSGSSSDSDSNQYPNIGLRSIESRDGNPNLAVGSGSSSDSDTISNIGLAGGSGNNSDSDTISMIDIASGSGSNSDSDSSSTSEGYEIPNPSSKRVRVGVLEKEGLREGDCMFCYRDVPNVRVCNQCNLYKFHHMCLNELGGESGEDLNPNHCPTGYGCKK